MDDEDSHGGQSPVGFYRNLLKVAERLHPCGLFHISGFNEKVVALTIDDGPSPITGEILDMLKYHDARATFFVHTDRIDREKASIRIFDRIVRENHELANHMPDHRTCIGMTADEFDCEFRRAHHYLSNVGPEPRLFRAAGGFFQEEKMMPSLKQHDYLERFIMASYLPWDTHIHFPRHYARHLAAGAFPGAIFVLHEGIDDAKSLQRTLETMRHLLKALHQKGYRIEPLGYLLELSG